MRKNLKKTTCPAEQNREDVQKGRKAFAETIKAIDIAKLVSLDESSVNPACSRNYGRALTNGRIKEGRNDVRFERESILSTIRLAIIRLNFFGLLWNLSSENWKQESMKNLKKPSILKSFIDGTCHGLDTKHMQSCRNGFFHRFNRRPFKKQGFHWLLNCCANCWPMTCSEIT